jgi:hypothetical protein
LRFLGGEVGRTGFSLRAGSEIKQEVRPARAGR